MKKFLLLLLVPALLWNCSTELDVLDDWEETMVVYCLLDQSSPRQYIRIEKAFLGAESALTMAQVYDSIYYLNQLEVTVQAMDANGLIQQTFTTSNGTVFLDTVEKDPGMFAGPNHVLYSFDTPYPTLNSAWEYKLTVINSETGKTVTASTDLVETSGSG
ncbi:MAG TPA: hypothetical protein VI731_06815, partial [Bacteroidia bacterium]|nr:hypothetical protein [Bacteroidia bacterium]